MGTTVLGQWLDVTERLHVLRKHIKTLHGLLAVDETVEPRYSVQCSRLASEVSAIQQETEYLCETLLQAQAAIEYTGEWAESSKHNVRGRR